MSKELQRIIIGGAARAGKSYLAAQLSESGSNLFVLTADALLHVYRRRAAIRTKEAARECLNEWFNRPRYMDPAQTITRRPIDDAGVPLSIILDKVRFPGVTTAVEIILAGLDAVAEVLGKDGWIILDLHPELYYPYYKQKCEDLKLLVVIRDPLESVAASLYWRNFPIRDRRSFKYFASLWLLCVYTVANLSRIYKGDIYCVTTAQICSGNVDLWEGIEVPAKGEQLYFSADLISCDDYVVFTLSDGRKYKLLEGAEVSYIETRCRQIFHIIEERNASVIIAPWWFNWLGTIRSKKLVDMIFDTNKIFRRIFSIYRSRISSLYGLIK